MFYLFLLLGLGFLVGRLFRPRAGKVGKVLTDAGLFVLIFAMGARLGADQTARAKLSSIGLSAFFLAFLSGMGAVVFAALFERLLERRKSR
ncbi:MAG: LysO family transporter [Candidatus Caldatribacterium sp.]|nr:LysO family transporter [Candidatus Caldatribacterium sp.]